MDNFMDKLAQRLTAQEMIKANSAADAAELERLQKQLAQYDACLQEMRKLSLKNMETTDKIGTLLDESIRKIQEIEAGQKDTEALDELLREQNREQKAVLDELLRDQSREQKEILTGMEQAVKDALESSREELSSLQSELKATVDGMTPALNDMVEKANDFVHKENVKVYRNVQAVIVEETKKQTEALEASQKKSAGKSKAAVVFSVLTLIAVVADIVLNLLMHFQIF